MLGLESGAPRAECMGIFVRQSGGDALSRHAGVRATFASTTDRFHAVARKWLVYDSARGEWQIGAEQQTSGRMRTGVAWMTVRDSSFNPEDVQGTWRVSHEGAWVSADAVRVECSRAPTFRIARVVKLQLTMPNVGLAFGANGIGSGGVANSGSSDSTTHVALQLGLVAALGVTANAVAVVAVRSISGPGVWSSVGATVDVDVATASQDAAWDVRGRASHPRFLELLEMEVVKHGMPSVSTKGLKLRVLGIDSAPAGSNDMPLAATGRAVLGGVAGAIRVIAASEERLWTAQAASNLVLPGLGGRGWLGWQPRNQ